MEYNIYCDESCHLEHDKSNVMVLGAIKCPKDKKSQIFNDIRNIKLKHGLSTYFEVKWTKVSASKVDFYLDILDYFWSNDDITYRGLVIKDKRKLDHVKYNGGNHNLWYYKMYYLMLNEIIRPEAKYNILVDIKDTRGGSHIKKLHEVLCNNIYDFKKDVIKNVCQIDSKQSELLQMADLINGAICFYNRHLMNNPNANSGKAALVKSLLQHKRLDAKSPLSEQKFNLFIWTPRG